MPTLQANMVHAKIATMSTYEHSLTLRTLITMLLERGAIRGYTAA